VLSPLLTLVLLVVLLFGPLPASLSGPGPDANHPGATPVLTGGDSGNASLLLGAGTLSISPSSSTIAVGGTVTMDVSISDTADLYGMDFCISFDGTIVSVPSNNAMLLWEVLDPVNKMMFANDVSGADGTSCPCTANPTERFYHYLVINVNPAEPFAGSGRFARLSFQGLAPGTTTLHFCYVMGSTRDGTALYPTPVDAAITVTGSTIPGDLNGDCLVDILDIMLVASHWNTAAGDPTYDARCDLNGDARVDIVDIMMVAAQWNQHCSSSPPD
jgi:hypothetical protein